MSWSYRGFDHPEAAQRALRAFDAGLDTVRIAEILGADEHEVAQVLAEERDARRRRARARLKRFEALLAAWTANDVDRTAVAHRFGYRDSGSASRCLYGYRRRTGRTTQTRREATR
ncbi:hypothetical protein ACFZ8E_11585 [Methylobacterium sp. HMF5984]|uniref:hypothetical protein n=1 Tax=Methylobacterium sp. HMF5984 TaxID=3367370 RepID=UPI00385393FF